jgi:pentatricopeptide repeat protein
VYEDTKEVNVASDVMTYNALIVACGKGGQWKDAFKVMISWLVPS